MLEAGIANPREYRDALIHDWFLRPDYIKHLDLHILRETKPADFFFHAKDGELKVQNKSYSIVWVNSPALIRQAKLALVSLRYCKYLDRGYALVKVLQDADNHEFPKLDY